MEDFRLSSVSALKEMIDERNTQCENMKRSYDMLLTALKTIALAVGCVAFFSNGMDEETPTMVYNFLFWHKIPLIQLCAWGLGLLAVVGFVTVKIRDRDIFKLQCAPPASVWEMESRLSKLKAQQEAQSENLIA